MPAWITSELRELVCTPLVASVSITITSRPASASARATARPTTPAPMTATSTLSGSLMRARRRSFERTHVLRDAAGYRDVEARLGRYAKRRTRRVLPPLGATIQAHPAAARDDLHELGRIGPEMKLARVDEPDGLFRTVGEEQGVGNDPTFEVDVGLRE